MLRQLFTQMGITILEVNGIADLFSNRTIQTEVQLSANTVNASSSVSDGSFDCLVAVTRLTFCS